MKFFGNKKMVLGIVLIASIIGGVAIYQSPAFHSTVSNPDYHGNGADPIQPLFYYCHKSPSADVSGWNTRTGSNPGTTFTIVNGGSCGSDNIEFTPNSTASAFAIYTGSSVDLSTASSHILQISNTFHWVGAGNNPTWHMFLTTNKTAPSEVLNYDPRNYATTVFDVQGVGGVNSFTVQVQLQVDQGKSITSTTNNQGSCSEGDSMFLCSAAYGNNTSTYFVETLLNYTGSSGSQTLNSLRLASAGSPGAVSVTSFRLPSSFNQIQPLYWGLEADPTVNAKTVEFLDNPDPPNSDPTNNSLNNLVAGIYSPPTVASQPPPYIDTGGFFGPIIKALISIGVFILSAIATAFGYVFAAFKAGLDIIGNFLGVGPIGSNLASALSNFAVWVTSIFGTAFTQVVNATNFIVGALTAFAATVGTYWGLLTSFLTDLGSFLGGLWSVLSAFLQYGSIAGKYGLVLWWVMGMSMAYYRIDLFMLWTRLSYMFIWYPFKAADWLFENVIRKIILRFKEIIFQWV